MASMNGRCLAQTSRRTVVQARSGFSARSRVACQAQKQAGEELQIKELKQELFDMVGDKGGLDMSKSDKMLVIDHLKKFQGLGTPEPEKHDMTGTKWSLLFTESEGSSSGKFGPIIGTTGQLFPEDKPGQYLNFVELPGKFLRLELVGEYTSGPGHKIDLRFLFVTAFLFGIPVLKKDFPENFVGFWKVIYADDALRIFTTNKDNMFAMYNEEAGKTVYANWSRFDKSKFT